MGKKIVEIECLRHKYPDKTEVSACGLDFVIKEGEKVGLVGRNGAGKSTLIKHLIGFLKPTEGRVSVFGVDPFENFSEIAPKVGVVMQTVEEQLIGPTSLEDVKFSPLNYGWSDKKATEESLQVMKKLGIANLKDKVIHYLSGGEKKRLALAGALAHRPKLLVLDEAFNQLDPESLKKVKKLITERCKEGMAVVMAVSSEEDVEFFEKIHLLEEGKITFRGSREEFQNLNKSNPFCDH